jgi:hypothetical protein
MGSAQSNNVTDIASNLSNTIKNSTEINSQQINKVKTDIWFVDCIVQSGAKILIDLYSQSTLRSEQLSSVDNTNSLANTIAQQALQQAMSKIGSLGIGYANASNYCNMTSSINNDVINTISQTATQINDNRSKFFCDNSQFISEDDFILSFSTIVDMYQSNILNSTNLNNIKNDVSQSVQQTASATVEGPAAALLALAVLIIAVGWSYSKVVTSEAGAAKPLITLAIVGIIGLLIFLAWYNSWWPFFNKLIPCSGSTEIGAPKSKCDNCINTKLQIIDVKNCPIKFNYPLFDKTVIAGLKQMTGADGVNLFNMACICNSATKTGKPGTSNNAGFTIESKIGADFSRDKFINLVKNAKFTDNTLITIQQNVCTLPSILIDPAPSANITNAYIKIPDQYLISDASECGTTRDCLSNVCTPGSFSYSGGTIDDPSQWGTRKGGPPRCPKSGIYTNPTTTTDIKNGIANPNTAQLITWIGTLRKNKVSDNTIYSFIRLYFVYIINESFPSGTINLEENAYIVHDFPEAIIIDVKEKESTVKIMVEADKSKLSANPSSIKLASIGFELDSVDDLNLGSSLNGEYGKITMVAGVCKNKDYQIHQFMQKVGNWLCLVIVLATIIFIWRM